MKINSCAKCSFETDEPLSNCPSCGGRLQSTKKVRILGWVMVGLGTLLVVSMGALGIFLAQLIVQSGEPGQTTRFSGGPQEIAVIMSILGLVIAFGLASIVGGVWQIKYGKPNRKLMAAMLLVAGILLVVGQAFRRLG